MKANFDRKKFVKYAATNAIIFLPIALIYGYLRGTSWSADDLALVVFILIGISVVQYFMFWSGFFSPTLFNKVLAQDLFPDPRFEETKPQEKDFMWDLKFYAGIFIVLLLLTLLVYFDPPSDPFSNDSAGDATAASMEASLEYELMDFPEE
jgi:hypothetical protein